MKSAPNSALSRRHRIRLFAYVLFMGVILLSCIRMQMQITETAAAEQNRMHRSILTHMNEENDALRRALRTQDPIAVRHHANTLGGLASLFASLDSTGQEDHPLCAVADTAQFYTALAGVAAQNGDCSTAGDNGFWQNAADTVSAHIASLALSLSDRQNPAIPTDAEINAAASLSAFSASFRTDPLRISSSSPQRFRFMREPAVSMAQARQILRSLVGNAASFLGNTVTDDAHGCYIFSCQNGYAEISHSGGHLLSYAFYPRGHANEHGIAVCDTDLLSVAAAFLKKAGLPYTDISVLEDRHGIRTFVSRTGDDRTVTVGIRIHDGAVASLQAEHYYTVDTDTAY